MIIVSLSTHFVRRLLLELKTLPSFLCLHHSSDSFLFSFLPFFIHSLLHSFIHSLSPPILLLHSIYPSFLRVPAIISTIHPYLPHFKSFIPSTLSSFTSQSKMNKDSVYLLEALAQNRYISPYFVVDVHAPCVQGLYYSLGMQEKKIIPTKSTFAGSEVMNTMKGNCSTYFLIFTIILWPVHSYLLFTMNRIVLKVLVTGQKKSPTLLPSLALSNCIWLSPFCHSTP